MFKFLFCLCWQTENKTYLDQVLDIAQDCTNQVSRTFKLQKGEFIFCEARLNKNQIGLIENRRKSDFADFELSPSPANTSKYKRKTLTTF